MNAVPLSKLCICDCFASMSSIVLCYSQPVRSTALDLKISHCTDRQNEASMYQFNPLRGKSVPDGMTQNAFI